MKRILAWSLALSMATVFFTGCTAKSEKTTETTTETPGGTTTETETHTIEQSGENPPPAH